MRIVFNNSVLVFAKSVWKATGRLIKVTPNEATSVNLPSGAKVYGRNLVDISTLRYYTILNDAGAEVADSSSYFKQYIPTFGGCVLRSNCAFSRVYFYNKDKELIFRIGIPNEPYYEVPAQHNGQEIAYVTIQTAALTMAVLQTMIVTRDEEAEPTTFEAYKSNANGEIYSPYSWVYADDLREITITAK
jgi:hypothetical protein